MFTYRPEAGAGGLGAPGPVFIHAHSCPRYSADRFPPALADFDVIVEARAGDNRVPVAHRARGADVDALLEQMLADPDVESVNVRHGTAGCHIVRITRRPVALLQLTAAS